MPNVNDVLTSSSSGATMLVPAGNADVTGACRVMGAHVTAADAASLSLYDAATAAGTALITIKSAANASTTVWFGPQGIKFATGVSSSKTGTTPNVQLFYIAG